MLDQMKRLLINLREQRPLIHHITNDVVTNFTANGTLSVGASPVMASEPKEAADMVTHARALVLNTGTMTDQTIEAMHRAGQAANRRNITVILDPVGFGTTTYRNEMIRQLLNDIRISVVRGNAAEIAGLSGVAWGQKGVDADEDGGNRAELAYAFVERYGISVAVTGKQDIVTDGKRTIYINNGHPLLSYITGSGCQATSMIAAFHGVTDDPLLASVTGLCTIGIAAEQAAEKAKGPGSMIPRILDALYLLRPNQLYQDAQIDIKGRC